MWSLLEQFLPVVPTTEEGVGLVKVGLAQAIAQLPGGERGSLLDSSVGREKSPTSESSSELVSRSSTQ